MANQTSVGVVWQLRVLRKTDVRLLEWPVEWNEWNEWAGEFTGSVKDALAFFKKKHLSNVRYQRQFYMGVFRGDRVRVPVKVRENTPQNKKREYRVETVWKLVQVWGET